MASLYQIKHVYRQGGQSMINRYFYYLKGTSSYWNAQVVANGFVALMLPKLRAVQPTSVVHLSVGVTNVITSGDSHLTNLSGINGLVNSDGLPPHDTYSFQLVKMLKGRSGRKAIGVPTEAQDDGTAGHLTELLDLALRLYNVWQNPGNTADYIEPVLAKKNALIWAITGLANVLWKRIGTQNSRKVTTKSEVATDAATYVTITTVFEEDLTDLASAFGHALPTVTTNKVDRVITASLPLDGSEGSYTVTTGYTPG